MKSSELDNLKKIRDEKDTSTLELINKIRDKEEQARQINDKESSFYTDIQNEISILKSEHRKINGEREKTTNFFKEAIENTKAELIADVKNKMEIVDKYDENANKQKISELKSKRQEQKTKLDKANNQVAHLKDWLDNVVSDPSFKKMYESQLAEAEENKETLENEFTKLDDELEFRESLVILEKENRLKVYMDLQNMASDIEKGFNENTYHNYMVNDTQITTEEPAINNSEPTNGQGIEPNSNPVIPEQGNNTNPVAPGQGNNQNQVVPGQENKDNQTTPNLNEGKPFDTTPFNLKFSNNGLGPVDNKGKLEKVTMKIGEFGIPHYYLKYENGFQDIQAITDSENSRANISDFKELRKQIKEEYGLDRKTAKKIDPYLFAVLDEEDANALIDKIKDDKDLDFNINYDMEYLKTMPRQDRKNFRKIARQADKIDGMEVENFKDRLYRRIANKLKLNSTKLLSGKEKVKQLGTSAKDKTKELGNTAKFKIKGVKNYYKYRVISKTGKLREKISNARDDRMINKYEKTQKKADKVKAKLNRLDDKIATRVSEQIKYDKLGNRITKTPEERAIDDKNKAKSDEILRNMHAQQREEK